MSEPIEVTAPSRLHCGMLSFGQPDVRAFGGLGIMLNEPGLRLTFSKSDSFCVDGVHTDRAIAFAQTVLDAWKILTPPGCAITVESAPSDHIGLGVGTQLALAVASGLARFLNREEQDIIALTRLVDRAARSSIGMYGFDQGGLILEEGRYLDDLSADSPILFAAPIPDDWRFVLFCPESKQGLFGAAERKAFQDLPPVAHETTDQLRRLAIEEIAPAVTNHDFDRFGQALYEFGYIAGECFAPAQGGPFANEAVSNLVAELRRKNIAGVGQTSWGPTVFAVAPNEIEAKRLIEQFSDYAMTNRWKPILASPCNTGGRVRSVKNAAQG